MILRGISCCTTFRDSNHLRLVFRHFLDRKIVATAGFCVHRPEYNSFRSQVETNKLRRIETVTFVSRNSFSTQNGDLSKNRGENFENVWTIPNLLTVSRIFMCPVLGYLVIHGNYPLAFGLFVVAGITDLLDGWIARTYPSQSSRAGSFLDPLADKLLIGTLFITLTISGLIPVPLTGLIVARDCLLVASAFVIRYISLPPPKTLRRYFDITLVTAQLAPTDISKYNTAVQLILVAGTLGASAIDYQSCTLLPILWYVTGATTVLSGLSYVFAKNTYRILSRPKAK